MINFVRVGLMVALWILSLFLMVLRTVMNEDAQLAVLSAWALWIGLPALAVTGWHVMDWYCARDDDRLQNAARLAARTALQHRQLDVVD
jgi:hypothetical protein